MSKQNFNKQLNYSLPAKLVQKNLTIFLRYFHRKQLKVPPYVETFNCPASDARVVRYDLIRGLHPRAPAVSYCRSTTLNYSLYYQINCESFKRDIRECPLQC